MPDMNENAETQQEYFGVHTDNKETLQNALKRIEELERERELAKVTCTLEGIKYCDNCAKLYSCKHTFKRDNCKEWEAAL